MQQVYLLLTVKTFGRIGQAPRGIDCKRRIALELSCALWKSAEARSCPFAILQSGGWVSGTPEWLPAARIFLAASIIGGYFVSAAFFLTSARLMGQDRAMLETVLQTGTLDSVRLICLQFCGRGVCPWHSSYCHLILRA